MGLTVHVTMTVNGRRVSRDVEARRTLADFLRDDLGHTGTHVGCEHGVCGACTVLVDGATARSCIMYAGQLEGADIRTVESLATDDARRHPILEALEECHGLQCGFCTPGVVMTIFELLSEVTGPTEMEAREALSGNLCRCTGYETVIAAVYRADSTWQRNVSHGESQPRSDI